MANGCRENSAVLLGGETAEMPGFYAEGEYDLAGFIVGIVDREKVIDGKRIAPGDVVLGLPSVGLHTNGYSLARKILFDIGGYESDSYVEELKMTVGDALLLPHPSYLRELDGLLDSGRIKGLAHITGGGLVDNIPRILPEGTGVEIKRGSWPELPLFGLMQRIGKVEDEEMFRAFNMGIGMIVICAPSDADDIKESVSKAGTNCYEIGRVVAGEREVVVA
jgi:phosphoribosylformylglycinamidine cyclo-ligase